MSKLYQKKETKEQIVVGTMQRLKKRLILKYGLWKKGVTINMVKHNLNTNDKLMMTLKVNISEFRSQTEKQIDDTQKECTSQFTMMKKTIIGWSAKAETTIIECKQDPVVNESSDAKIKIKQQLFLDKHQYQDSNF